MRRPVVISPGIVGDKNLHKTHFKHSLTSMSRSLQAEYAEAESECRNLSGDIGFPAKLQRISKKRQAAVALVHPHISQN
jgi:hypothetical protein